MISYNSMITLFFPYPYTAPPPSLSPLVTTRLFSRSVSASFLFYYKKEGNFAFYSNMDALRGHYAK